MALEEYGRKRNFGATPEPPPKLGAKRAFRFVVQKHRASRLHYDFRLELGGVLKSWAIPKGPSLDPADKRLAMMVEDHPVSYFNFEGIIPPDNYGAGTVEVWDIGTWEPLAGPGKHSRAELEKVAEELLAKGDLKFRLNGKKLKGEFVLVKTRSRRLGSKGNEWLLIKHRDDFVEPGYDIEQHDGSVTTGRTLDEIAADQGSAEWQSNRPPAKTKQSWLAKSIAIHDKKEEQKDKGKGKRAKGKQNEKSAGSSLSDLEGAAKRPIPRALKPMLATLVDEPFNDNEWIYELKFDGYRALAFIDDGKIRLLSRNQNELTSAFPELSGIAGHLKAKQAVVDGEICALDPQGRSSFSLMQQRTGLSGEGGRRIRHSRPDIPIAYYVFDLLYLDGYSLLRVDLEGRKRLLQERLTESALLRFSNDFPSGTRLYAAAAERGLEGIIAKRKKSSYIETRSREWLKVKITKTIECVIGGYTEPKGSREHFGSIILGLYDDRRQLVHVGQAGSGFSDRTHAEMWKKLQSLATTTTPFATKVESLRRTHWVKPKLVAQIKFTEWTHEGESGAIKLRAPVFLGLRTDKKPEECRFEKVRSAREEARKAEKGQAA